MLIHQHYEMELIQKQNDLKTTARAIADELLEHSSTKSDGLRVHQCADWLRYEKDPLTSRIITKGNFCRHRLCPICQWRRSCKYTAIFHKLFDNYPYLNGQHWIYLTLTQQNCHVTELRAALERMSFGFQRLRRQAFWDKNVLGAARFTEVTQQASDKAYAHPHYHSLLMVRPSMSKGNNYVSIEAWQG
ncbi:MAG: protein rep [Saccharospirillum sp.]